MCQHMVQVEYGIVILPNCALYASPVAPLIYTRMSANNISTCVECLYININCVLFCMCIRGDVKIHNCWLQHLTAMYSFSYINWLQLAAEYGGCIL